jgi:hypothetical protein
VRAETATRGAPSRATLARGLLALLAVLLIAWFAVLARNHSIGSSASGRVVADPEMSAAEWSDTMDEFERARLLDPSTDWRLIEAQFQLLRDKRAALTVAQEVLRDEPDNLGAWWVVLRAAPGLDDARYREAQAAVRRLNPTPAGR